MRPPRQDPIPAREHGAHTLRVWRGTVVGAFGRDVFIELGPRMQGVIGVDHFDAPPPMGAQFEFTLRGLEEGLWSLALSSEKSLVTWEQMEVQSLVHARVVRVAPGGLEVKIGPLHGFMPKSHSGLPKDHELKELVGREMTVEVIEVDAERQRCTVSRRNVLKRERDSERQRHVDQLKIGQIVNGHVTRIEDYGAFVAFGRGLEGLVHVSNLAHERVAHPNEVLKLGQAIELKVLSVKQGGKRIALGLKQVGQSPWRDLERTIYVGQMLEGVVTRVLDFGAFVAVRAGVEGLVPASESGASAHAPVRTHLTAGQKVSARVVSFDLDRERLSLSLLHASGARLLPDEAANAREFEELQREAARPAFARPLATTLREALERAKKRA